MNVVADGKPVLTATGMHVAVSGMTGQPVVVLLHCMGRSGTMWDRHRALLAERFRVLAPDLPGHGKSAGPFTVTGAVTAVADALSRSCGDEPAHLVGLSLVAEAVLNVPSFTIRGGTNQILRTIAAHGLGIWTMSQDSVYAATDAAREQANLVAEVFTAIWDKRGGPVVLAAADGGDYPAELWDRLAP